MKVQWTAFSVLAAMLCVAGMAMGEGPSAEQGEKLFNDPALGGSTNAASCSTCHPGGKGLAAAGDNPQLGKMINTCIENALGGGNLDEHSAAFESLQLYIRSLAE